MTSLLNYKIIGQGHPVIICHGFLGSSDNWVTIAKQLSEHFQFILPDLRNHGTSFHDPQHHYEAMAADLFALCEHLNLNKLSLIGHSMGGKTCLKFAELYPEITLSHLILVDIGPLSYTLPFDEIFQAIDSVDLTAYTSISAIHQHLSGLLNDEKRASFILKNLGKKDGKWLWKSNINVLKEAAKTLGEDRGLSKPLNTEVSILKGELSSYLTDDHQPELQHWLPNHKMIVVPNADHWVQADAPLETRNTLETLLSKS